MSINIGGQDFGSLVADLKKLRVDVDNLTTKSAEQQKEIDALKAAAQAAALAARRLKQGPDMRGFD